MGLGKMMSYMYMYFLFSFLFFFFFFLGGGGGGGGGGAKNYKKILGDIKFCGNSFQSKSPVPQLDLWPSPSSTDFTQLPKKGGNMARIHSRKIQTHACRLSVTSSFCVDCFPVLVCLYERPSQDALVKSTCRSVLRRKHFCPSDMMRRFSRRLVSE